MDTVTHSEMTCRRVTAEDTHITRRQDGILVPVILVPVCLPFSVPLLFPDETFYPVRSCRRAGPALPGEERHLGSCARSHELRLRTWLRLPGETLVW